MNSGAKAARRRQAIIVLIIAIVIALAAMWVRMVQKKNEMNDSAPEVERTDPDYMVENFTYYRFKPDGNPQYEVHGVKLTHFPVDDSYKVEHPLVYQMNRRNQVQSIEADEAFIEDFNTKVHLTNNVKVEEEGAPGKAPRTLTTDYLLIYPDDEVMTSDKEVTIRQGKNVMHGVGMTANSATQELEMRGRVHVTLYPNGDKADKKPDENAPQDNAAAGTAQPAPANTPNNDEP